jgi:hypothetical protein
MPEGAVGKDWNGHEGRIVAIDDAQEIGHSQFRNVVGAPADHRLEDFRHDPSGVEPRVYPLDLDAAVHQRLGAS